VQGRKRCRSQEGQCYDQADPHCLSDLKEDSSDAFIRHWVQFFNRNGEPRTMDNESQPVRIFVDTGANVNTISRMFMRVLENSELQMRFIKGPKEGLTVNLAGGQILNLTRDKVKIVVEVVTSMGPHVTLQEFLVMDHDGEDLVMKMQWHATLVGGNRAGISRIVDVDIFGVPTSNPLDSMQDEDLVLDASALEDFPETIQEGMGQCHFNEDLPKLDKVKEIIANHGSVIGDNSPMSCYLMQQIFNHQTAKIVCNAAR
jgi:hypothetical protein